MRAAGALVAAVVLVTTGCGGEGLSTRPERPYVVTAIDYHFHDAHPSRPIPLDRALEFSNQGRNVHSVTIPGTDVDRNIRPGERVTFEPIGSLFEEPGRYPFYCRFHRDRAMSGTLVVAPARD
ncbi:MAG: cupredoxin domain-containing protein [Actinomycetota bacterium]